MVSKRAPALLPRDLKTGPTTIHPPLHRHDPAPFPSRSPGLASASTYASSQASWWRRAVPRTSSWAHFTRCVVDRLDCRACVCIHLNPHATPHPPRAGLAGRIYLCRRRDLRSHRGQHHQLRLPGDGGRWGTCCCGLTGSSSEHACDACHVIDMPSRLHTHRAGRCTMAAASLSLSAIPP